MRTETSDTHTQQNQTPKTKLIVRHLSQHTQAALPPPRPAALESYLARLEEVPPALLAVYAFHMYMALLR